MAVGLVLQTADSVNISVSLCYFSDIHLSVEGEQHHFISLGYPVTLGWVNADQSEWILVVFQLSFIVSVITATTGLSTEFLAPFLLALTVLSFGDELHHKIKTETVFAVSRHRPPESCGNGDFELVLTLLEQRQFQR